MGMHETDFAEAVRQICAGDCPFDRQAFHFVREALDFTTSSLEKPKEGDNRHISGRQLTEGIRKYALQEFGPMAATVLKEWGITKTEDFGRIVFLLVETGKLGKTENDRIEDFMDGYDFYDAFTAPFLPDPEPAKKSTVKRKPSPRNRK
jgi:uncharacterized repeat protein (TIGR04138 family)